MNRIFHFSYHKCLTVYYSGIMKEFSELKGFSYKHFNANKPAFIEAYEDSSVDCASLNNRLCVSLINNDVGSHFVRDPRDLIVSGYHYHMKCKEPWVLNKDLEWGHLTSDPLFEKWIGPKKWAENVSFQEFLQGLNQDQGFILEIIWRGGNFRSMEEWDYNNPRILEMKYEDIIDREEEYFDKLFSHYKLPDEWRSDWLDIVNRRSMKSIKTNTKHQALKVHARNGGSRQFEREFSADVLDDFNDKYNDLIIKLGY
jgi:hypothetical protein